MRNISMLTNSDGSPPTGGPQMEIGGTDHPAPSFLPAFPGQAGPRNAAQTSGALSPARQGGEGGEESIEWVISMARGESRIREKNSFFYGLELINARLDEHARQIFDNLAHTREMTRALIAASGKEAKLLTEAGIKEAELKIEAERERTNLVVDGFRKEAELNLEANAKQTELLIKSIKESVERAEVRFRDENEKAEVRMEKFVREIKDSNNKVHGYTMANIIGFASLLIAIGVLIWSVKTIELPATPPVTINQTIPPAAAATTTSPGFGYDAE